jgi:hypothetical protein
MADTAATQALILAGQAKDTAEGKRRVFVATPYTPYDIGDLWVNGQDLRRCATARASGSYTASDWVIAVAYDNTKTVIDGGIVTSGTIRLAGSGGSILAGITGNGTDNSSVRIWAGAPEASKASAPFRVLQDGALVASKATITGTIYATSGEFTGKITASSGKIGGFTISSGNMIWSQSDYLGNGSRILRVGLSSDTGGAVDISFNAATPGAFGVKSVGRAPGGAAIYASSETSQTYPSSEHTWAGYFDGGLYATRLYAANYYVKSGASFYPGISFGTSKDLDKIRLTVMNGIITQVIDE